MTSQQYYIIVQQQNQSNVCSLKKVLSAENNMVNCAAAISSFLHGVLDLSIDTIWEEPSSSTSSVQVGNSQNLRCSPGEGDCIAVDRGQSVVPSGGVVDSLIIHGH